MKKLLLLFLLASPAFADSPIIWGPNGNATDLQPNFVVPSKVAVGATSATRGTLDVENATGTASAFLYSWAGTHSILEGASSRGTRSAPTATQSGDSLFSEEALGYNGSSTVLSAEIDYLAAENFTLVNHGAGIRFLTTPTAGGLLGEKMRLSSQGLLGIGTTAPAFSVDAQVDGAGAFISDTSYSTGNSANFIGRRARGSQSFPAAVQTFDQLANFTARGYNGSAFSTTVGGMSVKATENWTPTANGSQIAFITQANGTTTQQIRELIDQNGHVGIGTVTPAFTLDIVGEENILNSVTDTGATGVMATASSASTVDGSNTTVGVYGAANATVAATFTNDKSVSGGVFSGERSGGDDGTLQELTGVTALTQHQTSVTGTTVKEYGVHVTNLMFAGNVTNLYDFASETIPAGAVVTNHYGLFLGNTGVTATNEWGLYEDTTAQNYLKGSLGVGTSTPGSKLDVSEASVGGFAATITNSSGAVSASGLLVDVPDLTGGSNVIQQWKANGAELMALTPNGVLNMTQTFPELAFSGSAAIQDVAGAPGIEIFVGGGFANTAIARTGNAVTAKFTSSGNMGLGIGNADADERFVVGDGHTKTTQTTAPTAVPDPVNLGTAPTCVLNAGATDTAGEVTIVSDIDAPVTPGSVCDITFNAAYVGSAHCQVSPKNQISSAASAKVFESATTTDLVLSFAGGALPSSTYVFDYYCVGTN